MIVVLLQKNSSKLQFYGYKKNKKKEIKVPKSLSCFQQIHHLDVIAVGGRGKVQCPHCFKVMKNPEKMKRHMMTHNVVDRSFVCEICNRVFPKRDHMIVHQRTHTGEKPFACHLCNYRSAQRSNLNTHIRTKHPDGVPWDTQDQQASNIIV